MVQTVFLASSNANKLEEIKRLLPHLEILSAADIGKYDAPIEDGDSFADNALIKAKYGVQLTNIPCLADDSGIEVEALGGAPGIFSARYAQDVLQKGQDINAANNIKLLQAMQLETNRRAKFVCALAMCLPNGEQCQVEANWQGVIANESCGVEGFGYDPLFIPDGYQMSVAQLGSKVKQALSHRMMALTKLKSELILRAWLDLS